jgi:hypothetical protein
MKLYHFTTPENLLLIHLYGLKPSIHQQRTDPGAMDWQTMGQPVVWLTKQESNRATQAHVDHFKPLNLECNVGDPIFGGPVRLAVDVERHNKRLVKYTTFLENTTLVHPETGDLQNIGRDVLRISRATPGCVDRWWIYFGTIAPRKIEFAPGLPPGKLTIRLALPGADFRAEMLVDPMSRSRFAELARRMRAADNPDMVADFPLVEDPLQPADALASFVERGPLLFEPDYPRLFGIGGRVDTRTRRSPLLSAAHETGLHPQRLLAGTQHHSS